MGKTAVVIIHGIGEQRPMGTLRGFIRLFAGDWFRSKVDRRAGFYDLRRLATFAAEEKEKDGVAAAMSSVKHYPPDTEFFEFYWAFHFRDTSVSLTVRWVLQTLWRFVASGEVLRLRWRVHIVLLCVTLLLLLVVSLVTIAIVMAVLMLKQEQVRLWSIASVAAGVAAPAIMWLSRPYLLGWIGDAARYFGDSPETPVERQQIRKEGIQLLRRLHKVNLKGDKPVNEYDRIVVVGHSLGSVIAYDLILHYWGSINHSIEIGKNSSKLLALDGLVKSVDAAKEPVWTKPGICKGGSAVVLGVGTETEMRCDYAKAQSAIAPEIAKQWRITDLVTLGSPLTFAHLLMAKDKEELRRRQLQRELATCPPVRDGVADASGFKTFYFQFGEDMKKRNVVAPHHTAPFMAVQWTNVYFPADPIGGPVAPNFGNGVQDVEVRLRGPGSFGWQLKTLLGGAHIHYWSLIREDPDDPASKECAEVLRTIISKKDPPAGGNTAADPAPVSTP